MNKENIEELISLASYFRSALQDELQLPEQAVTMPEVIKVNQGKLVQLSPKLFSYRRTLEDIENVLEGRVKELIGETKSSPAQKEIKFPKEKPAPKKPVVTNENVPKLQDYIIRGDSKQGVIYKSLYAIPNVSEEDKEFILHGWENFKGNEEKAKVYNKVQDLLNNYKLSVATLKDMITHYTLSLKRQNRIDNEIAFKEELKKKKIVYAIGTPLEKLFKGEELLNGKTQFYKDNEFNVALLVGAHTEEEADPEDFIKAWAIYLRTTGREREAIDIITKFYSDSKKGEIWTPQQATIFLNMVFKTNGLKHLEQLIANILMFKEEKENSYKKGIPQAKNLVKAFCKSKWPEQKIDKLVDRVIMQLADAGKIAVKAEVISKPKLKSKPENTFHYLVEYFKSKKGNFLGTVLTPERKINVTNYPTLEAFKKACFTVAVSHARTMDEKVTNSQIKMEYKNTKAGGTASTKSTSQKEKVVIQTKPKTTVPAKVTPKAQNSPNKPVKKESNPNAPLLKKEAVKQPKKPQYSAFIVLEKDKTYTCTLKGFNEVIKVTGSKSIEEAKADFMEALIAYSEKIKAENEKAKASAGKGKKIHMKPDFTTGELVFYLQQERKAN